MRVPHILVLVSTTLCLAAGCGGGPQQPDAGIGEDGGDGGSDGSDSAGDRVQTARERYVQTRCGWMLGCESEWGRVVQDMDACLSYFDKLLDCLYDPPVRFDDAAAELCADHMDQVGCAYDLASAPAACEDAITFGDPVEIAGLGESCQELPCDYDAGLYCDYDTPEGVCPVCKRGARVGEPCSWNPYLPCDRDGYCDETTSRCVALKGIGMPCTEMFQCQLDLYCKDGLCIAPLGRDQPCSPDTDFCDAFLACRGGVCTDRGGDGETCTPDPRPDAQCVVGATCHRSMCRAFDLCADAGPGQPCAYDCVDGAYCHPDHGECTPCEAVGQPCPDWDACVDGAYCADGLCTAYAQVGESCEDRLCVDDAVCVWDDTFVCITPRANGEDCPDGWWCASTYCDPQSGKCTNEPPCTMP